jgi:acetamidase/formamidase
MELCQRVLAVPFKRARSRSIEYLEYDEIQAVLTTIDRHTVDGRHDYALLATMFNTGARVQEIVSLRVGDVRFDKPPQVRLFGKGRKERICPLWPQTAEILRAFLALRWHAWPGAGGAPGMHSIVPPRRVGGNMGVRAIAAGTELYLPVEMAGALFSVGDTHAAQGDGEVCGASIKSPMRVALKFELIKQAPLSFPRFTTPGPGTSHLDRQGYEVSTGIGPDLMEAARDAVRGMVELLSRRHGMPPAEACMLCSVCGDLRISEIVDLPNRIVSFYFPRAVFA